MFSLGQHIGRQDAHNVVYECAMDAFEKAQPFLESLVADERVTQHLSREVLAGLLGPEQYIELASVFVERVLQQTES